MWCLEANLDGDLNDRLEPKIRIIFELGVSPLLS